MRGAFPIRSKRRRGFTLIEILLSIGIMTFCLVSMITLMSVGVTAMNDAGGATAQGQIISSVSSGINATAFSDIPAYVSSNSSSTPLIFDKDGLALDKTDTAHAFFSASLSLSSVTYPGSTASSGTVQTVGVDITRLIPGTLTAMPQNLATTHVALIVSR